MIEGKYDSQRGQGLKNNKIVREVSYILPKKELEEGTETFRF